MPTFETQAKSLLNTEPKTMYTGSNTNGNGTKKPSPPYSVPFTVSLLISESLFKDFYSPATTLIIPFIRIDIPFGYWIVILLNFWAALLAKWSYGSAYSVLGLNRNTEVPDFNAISEFYNLYPEQRIDSNQSASSPSGRYGAKSVSALSVNGNSNAQNIEDTPLFPKGMTLNISFSAPFTAPISKTSTLFTIELKEIKNIPGYIVPLATLVLYFVLQPYFKAKEEKSKQK